MLGHLLQRGHQVTLYDQTAPLAGGSGNPLALLNPKLCPAHQTADHLMTLGMAICLESLCRIQGISSLQIHQLALKHADELLDLATQYPKGTLAAQQRNRTYATKRLCQFELYCQAVQFLHINCVMKFLHIHTFSFSKRQIKQITTTAQQPILHSVRC